MRLTDFNTVEKLHAAIKRDGILFESSDEYRAYKLSWPLNKQQDLAMRQLPHYLLELKQGDVITFQIEDRRLVLMATTIRESGKASFIAAEFPTDDSYARS